MTAFYGYKRLAAVSDWRGLAGDDKWVPTRSAYELAHCWHESRGLPAPIAGAFAASGYAALQGLTLDLSLVEKPVFLDTNVGPSMTDLMAYGSNAKGEPIVLAVEGKADESFGPRISTWVRGNGRNSAIAGVPRPTRVQRLEFLSRHLGVAIPLDSTLRYQLFHRAVSAVLEAQLHGASAAIVLVHAFGPDSAENLCDFSEFLRHLGDSAAAKGTVAGPFQLGEQQNLPTYFLWWQQPVRGGGSAGEW